MRKYFESKPPDEIKETREKSQRAVLEIGAGGSPSPYLNDANIEYYRDAHIIRTDLFVGNESETLRKRFRTKIWRIWGIWKLRTGKRSGWQTH